MKRFLVLILSFISVLFLQSCDHEMISSGYPNVITHSAIDNGEKLVFTGEIINEDNIKIDEVGFIWQNTDDPFAEPGFQVKVPQVSSGYFSTEIAWSLTNNKNYVLRAYAKCSEKVVYGDSLVFNTVLIASCKLFKIEPDSAFRGDTIRFIGQGFNQTLSNNKVLIDGKNTRIIGANDSVLVCIVPNELTKGSKSVNILVNNIGGNFEQKFKLLLPPKPVVVSSEIIKIEPYSTVVGGKVTPNNMPCTVIFEYGLTTNYGQTRNAIENPIFGGDPTDVSAELNNLTPTTTYHFRIKAESESGIDYGDDLTFTTPEAPPVTTLSATNITRTSARLNGILVANYLSTSASFEYGSTNSLGSTIPASPSPIIGNGPVQVGVTILGLATGTTYYFRLKTENSLGISYGGIVTFVTESSPYSVTDIEGNIYPVVQIGTQYWMAENLKTTKYNDNTSIPLVTDNSTWAALNTPAYCWYDNNASSYKDLYGALYNFYAVSTGKLCPSGWHVPSNLEFTTLTNYLGDINYAGGKLKEAGTTHWSSPNTGATNETGFTALPAGYRLAGTGVFSGIGLYEVWWSSTPYNEIKPWYRSVGYQVSLVFVGNGTINQQGVSIRCILD